MIQYLGLEVRRGICDRLRKDLAAYSNRAKHLSGNDDDEDDHIFFLAARAALYLLRTGQDRTGQDKTDI